MDHGPLDLGRPLTLPWPQHTIGEHFERTEPVNGASEGGVPLESRKDTRVKLIDVEISTSPRDAR